jgi:hypothetical protein
MAPEIELLAERVLRDARMEPVAPVDVRLLASRLGLAVRFDSIPGAKGLLRIDRGRPTVVVERHLSRVRTRFTLGHEIGHWVLAAYPDETREIWSAQPGLRDAERFCDVFAAALLLPLLWMEASLTDDDQTLSRLLWLASRADVSPATAVIRATRVARWRRLLLQVRWRGSRWRVLSASGHIRGPWRNDIGMTRQSAECLAEVMDPEQPDQRDDWLVLQAGRWTCEVPCQMRRRGTSALIWVDPERARGTRPSVEPKRDAAHLTQAP